MRSQQDVKLDEVKFDNGMVFFMKHYHYENGILVRVDYSKADIRSHVSMQQSMHIYEDVSSVMRAIKRYKEIAKG